MPARKLTVEQAQNELNNKVRDLARKMAKRIKDVEPWQAMVAVIEALEWADSDLRGDRDEAYYQGDFTKKLPPWEKGDEDEE